MTVASVGTFVSVNDKNSVDPWSGIAVANNNAVAGRIAFLVVVSDNVSSSDTETNYHVAVTDTAGGNTWVKIAERSGPGNTASAVSTSLWMCHVATSITTSHTIAVDLSAAITAKAITGWVFTADTALELVDYVTGVNAASIAIADLDEADHLFIAARGQETSNAGFTPTSSWTGMTITGTTGGSAGDNIHCKSEFIIDDASTGATSNPTWGSPDSASILAAFIEAAAGNVTLTLATATEDAAAQPLDLHVETGALPLALAIATETIEAQPLALTVSTVLHWAEATEDTTAQPLGLVNTTVVDLELPLATETVTAQPLDLQGSGSVALTLATATEGITAQPLQCVATGTAEVALAAATEAATASPLALHVDTGALQLTVATATEATAAQPLSLVGSGSATLQIVTAVEEITAQPLNLRPAGAITLTVATAAEDTDVEPLSLTPTGAAVLTLAPATEESTAVPLSLHGTGTATLTLAAATEQTTAKPLGLHVVPEFATVAAGFGPAVRTGGWREAS